MYLLSSTFLNSHHVRQSSVESLPPEPPHSHQ